MKFFSSLSLAFFSHTDQLRSHTLHDFPTFFRSRARLSIEFCTPNKLHHTQSMSTNNNNNNNDSSFNSLPSSSHTRTTHKCYTSGSYNLHGTADSCVPSPFAPARAAAQVTG